jgi:hypothetical protein
MSISDPTKVKKSHNIRMVPDGIQCKNPKYYYEAQNSFINRKNQNRSIFDP